MQDFLSNSVVEDDTISEASVSDVSRFIPRMPASPSVPPRVISIGQLMESVSFFHAYICIFYERHIGSKPQSSVTLTRMTVLEKNMKVVILISILPTGSAVKFWNLKIILKPKLGYGMHYSSLLLFILVSLAQ